MPKFKKTTSPLFQMKGMTFKEGQTPMKSLNSPMRGGLSDLFQGVAKAVEGIVKVVPETIKSVTEAGTGIVKGVTGDIKEGIAEVKANRAKRQSQKSTTQGSEDDDKKKKTDSEKIGDALGAGFTAAGARMGGHIDQGEIIQTGSGSGEQSATVPDVTTIIASKDSTIKPITKTYTKETKPTTSKWGFDTEEENPIIKKSKKKRVKKRK